MKKSVIKFFDKIIVVLLGFVGLSSIVYSCSDYGVILPEFEIKGVVTDKTTAKPIQNIRIIGEQQDDTLYTNSKGEYASKFWGSEYSLIESGNPIRLKFEDIDGEENGGEFETQGIDIKFTKADRIKRGKPEKYVKTQNIQLEHKK